MPVYRYRAVSVSGEVVEGEMAAGSQSAVIGRLQDLGHLPVRAEEVSGVAGRGWLSRELFSRGRVAAGDLALLTRELATLLGAGLPLERSLAMLAGVTEKEGVRRIVGEVRERVRGGASLADALAAHPRAFPPYYVSMVRAGESGGALDVVLERLADYLEKSRRLSESVKSALIYPAILVVMAGVSLVLLLTVVVPEFKPLFEDAAAATPLAMRVLIAVGEAFQRYWWLGVLALAGVFLLARGQLANPAYRARWDGLVLRIPVVGELVTKIEIARLSRTLGTLLRNGVPVLGALSIVKGTLGNSVVAAAVEDLGARVKEGEGLARSLGETGVFPDLPVQMVQIGEETGELEDMLVRVADIYDQEVQRTTQRMLSLLVPTLTIGLGALIALIIGSVIVAILSVNSLAF